MSDINHNSKVWKTSLKEAERTLNAKGNNGTVLVNVTEVRRDIPISYFIVFTTDLDG